MRGRIFLPQIIRILQCWARMCSLETFGEKGARDAGVRSVLCAGGQESCIPFSLGMGTAPSQGSSCNSERVTEGDFGVKGRGMLGKAAARAALHWPRRLLKSGGEPGPGVPLPAEVGGKGVDFRRWEAFRRAHPWVRPVPARRGPAGPGPAPPGAAGCPGRGCAAIRASSAGGCSPKDALPSRSPVSGEHRTAAEIPPSSRLLRLDQEDGP